MRIDGPQITGSFNLNGDTVADLDIFTTTSSFNMMTSSMATTGSNIFKGTQTSSGSIVPSVNNTYDLGSPTRQFRHVYISSGSLYVNGTKVLGSTAQELQITTDAGQSFKILESSSDTITLQSADGNVTLTSTGQGDIVMDPNTGVIGLKGTVTIYTGNKITSSDGNAIQFGNGIAITGSIVATGTNLISGSSQITYSGLSGVPSDIISGSGQLTTLGVATTGSNTFNGNLTVTGFIDTQELRTTYISSSILYRSGSTKFGDELTDTHSFTGSILISGSISVPGSNLVSGSSQVLNGSGVFSGSAQLPSGIVSSSAQTIANLPSGTVSGSAQVVSLLPSGTVSGSAQILNGTGFVKTSGASITYDNSTYLTTGTASSTYLPLAGGTVSGDIQMGSNQNFSIKFRTATAWDYSLKGINDDFFIRDNPGLNYLALYYNTGGNNRYTSLMNVFNVYASGAATLSGNLTLSSSSSTTDLGGVLIVRGNGSAYSTHYLTTGAANVAKYIQYDASGNAKNQIFAGGDSYITGGNFGIGISSPQGLLDVYKSTSGGLGGHIYLRNNGAAVGNEMAVMFVDGDATTMRAAISSTTEGAPYYGDIKFKTGLGTYASLNTRMTISGEGKVGIGFTPSYKLQVAGEITTHAGTNTSYYAYMNYLGTTYNFGSGETSDNVDFKIAGGGAWGSGGNFRWFTQTGGATPTERFRLTPTGPAYFTNKLTVGGTGNYSSATLSVEGPVRSNRSIYSWYQAGTNAWDGYAYLHLKTNMWAGGGGTGNVHYTMSLFYARLYSYSSNYIREGSIGFHNWSGSIYNLSTTGNIWYNAYTSSDGYVVLSLAIGSGSYMGVTVDWHQAYGYPLQDKIVTAASPSNTASGVY